MPGKKGTIKAEDGNYYTPEEMVKANLRPINPANRSLLNKLRHELEPNIIAKTSHKNNERINQPKTTKNTNNPDELQEVYEVRSAEEPHKLSHAKKDLPGDKERYPRVMVTTFDEKGKHTNMSFLVKPDTFHINRNETISYSPTGKPKRQLYISMEFDVVEVE